MTTDRRLHDMGLGRRAHARWLGSSRYAGSGPPPPLTLPTTNLLAAYDARVGVTNVSGACSAWADQSGNGKHATQGTAGSRPTISSTGGYPSLLFNGTTNHMTAPVVAAAGVKTIYAVMTPTVDSGARMFCGGATGLAGIGALNTLHQANDNSAWRNTGVAYASGRQRLAYEMQSSGLTFRKNGVAASPVTWATNPTFAGVLYIGAAAPFTWAFAGHIHALFVYGAAHNAAVGSYITQEWGV